MALVEVNYPDFLFTYSDAVSRPMDVWNLEKIKIRFSPLLERNGFYKTLKVLKTFRV